MLTRWMRCYRNSTTRFRRVTKSIPYSGIPQSPYKNNFKLPDHNEMVKIKHIADIPENLVKENIGVLRKSSNVWIPNDAIYMKFVYFQLRVLVRPASWKWSDKRWNQIWIYMTLNGCRYKRILWTAVYFAAFKSQVTGSLDHWAPGNITQDLVRYCALITFILVEARALKKYVMILKDDLSSYCWLDKAGLE